MLIRWIIPAGISNIAVIINPNASELPRIIGRELKTDRIAKIIPKISNPRAHFISLLLSLKL